MSWLSQALSSSLGKKLLMALTGLFLIFFLTGHLLGNFLLFKEDGGQSFNEYAKFMTTTPAILLLSIVTYACIIFHVIYSIVITIHNRNSRPVRYAVTNPSANSLWTSRSMGVLGTIVLIFVVIHLKSFWYEMKFGSIPIVDYSSGSMKDLYRIVNVAFTQLWYVAFYVFSMIILSFHLSHGFKSAFQTLGLSHVKYTPLIKIIGMAYAIIVPLLFASMPVYLYMKSHGLI
ncbi:MAG: succinate dehydrogenase cytochrome b subunit [Bacteroidetes bacterium]|nr:succinate dehydrogenase cytochrome b subunit [Bacteroidota bacterium]MDA1121431.1 succinate dehydrogenase cytochrome b subunit [Bacteroidota bacterium]